MARTKDSGRLVVADGRFLANRDLATGASTDWDVVPQFQVTLSKRQHIRADVGVRIPVTNTGGRPDAGTVLSLVGLGGRQADGRLVM